MRVKALQKIYYGRQDRQPGDTYDMDDREAAEAKILAVLGKIEIVASAPESKKSEAPVKTEPTTRYRAAALSAEEEPSASAEPMTTENTGALTGGERKRFYRRRDMKAEQ
jgi:hypothetical protein